MTPDALDQEHRALLAAIGRALGQHTLYEELHGERENGIALGTMQSPPASACLEVLGGAVSPETGLVGWIEEKSDPPEGGHVPVTIDLHVARGGQRISSLEVPTYNPYFGCRVRHMRWYGDALIVLYREKHRMILARLDPPYTGVTMVGLHDRCIVDGDTVYFVSEHEGLLEGRLLPSLAPALPLPPPFALRDRSLWQPAPGRLSLVEIEGIRRVENRNTYLARVEATRAAAPFFPLPPPEARPLVGTPESLQARLRELLAPSQPPPLGVDVLVGSVATPFWRPERQLATRYAEVGRSWYLPDYLAVYWHQHLVAEGRAVEARAWRHWLDQVATLTDVDPVPWVRSFRGEELTARTALIHLKARAAVLAKVCRKGRLPEWERCYFFSPPRSQREHLERDEAYPPGFREVMRQLNALGPKSLSER